MTITQNPSVHALVDTLTVILAPEDYREEYEQAVKEYRKRIQLPGFRPGTVPASLVRKRFGGSILAEKVNAQVTKLLGEYLETRSEGFLGRPYLVKSSLEGADPEVDTPLTFDFEIGRQPEFSLQLENLAPVTDYRVEVTEADIDRQIERYRYQHSHGDAAEYLNLGETYLVQGILSSEPRPKLVLTADAPVDVEYDYRRSYTAFTGLLPGLKALTAGKSVGETVTLVPAQVFADDTEGATELRVSQEQYAALRSQPLKFELRAARSTPYHPLNEEFFAHLFPDDTPVDEADFRQRVRHKLETEAVQLNGLYLTFRLKQVLLERHSFELPDRVLQAFFFEETQAEKGDAATFAQRYAQYREEMRLHLIRRKLAEIYPAIELSDEEFRQGVRERLKAMFPTAEVGEDATETDETSGLPEVEDIAAVSETLSDESPEHPMLDLLLQQVLGNPQFAEREYQQAQNARFFEVLREQVIRVEVRQASYTEFERHITSAGF